MLYRSLESFYKSRPSDGYSDKCKDSFFGNADSIKSGLKNAAYSSLHRYNSCIPTSALSKSEFLALKQLSKNKQLVIQKADKGNSVVLLNRTDYIQKMNSIVSDRTKFIPLDIKKGKELSFMEKCERTIRSILDDVTGLTPLTLTGLQPSGSRPGRLYGLSKIHKNGAPLRPILSAIGTPTYALAKFLVPLLRPLTENCYTVTDSFSFAKEISSIEAKGLYMTSFDAESLFTNIPLDETVTICTSALFPGGTNLLPEDYSTLTSNEFASLLKTAVSEVPFLFNGEYYKQIDGVAMGSPLGPSLANAFLAKWETEWLNSCPSAFKPVFYRRYVDDTFVLFKSRDHVAPFMQFLNSQHPNIRFTCESEKENCLNFLDITVTRKGSTFETSVYRKPTFSGLFTNFDSFLPMDYKIGLIRTLLHRGFELCSKMTSFHSEVEFLKTILRKNGYPLQIMDSIVREFLNKKFGNGVGKPATVPRKRFIIVLPFMGGVSLDVKKNIKALFMRYIPNNDVHVIFRPMLRVSMLFMYKDKIPSCLRSSCVYKYQCTQCKSVYIGQTRRFLHKRISEHIGKSHLTGKVLTNPRNSPVFSHIAQSKCPRPEFDDFSVLYSTGFEFHLKILESLEVARCKPALNRNVETLKLLLF